MTDQWRLLGEFLEAALPDPLKEDEKPRAHGTSEGLSIKPGGFFAKRLEAHGEREGTCETCHGIKKIPVGPFLGAWHPPNGYEPCPDCDTGEEATGQLCERPGIGMGGDTWDPSCDLPEGHDGPCSWDPRHDHLRGKEG
jgi:hypothetical protein